MGSELFSAAEARRDRWAQLSIVARAWSAARARGTESPPQRAEAAALLDALAPLEAFFAYPGARLFAALRESAAGGDAATCSALASKTEGALTSGAYRHDVRAWDPNEELDSAVSEYLPPGLDAEAHRPYFEVLVVTPADPGRWERTRQDLRRLRRPEDPFVYELVHVGSFEDALIGVAFNTNVQAVVLYDGFQFQSKLDVPLLREFLARVEPPDADAVAVRDYCTALARLIRQIRPELDVYLCSERDVETLAGRPDAEPIRRIFYGVEELMEIHLSLLDGVGARYETPFFSNLVRYSQRPVGTFHALPVARGKSIFRSNWIRDMGRFYGANLFLAESSATSGGLDSLLEPTGNIKKAQELAARAFGADRAYFATNGTSTSNKIVLQALLAPGDIALVDRNCHKSHHYGFVLSGVQPVYLEAYPLPRYSMYGGVPLRSIKAALLALAAEGKLERARLVDLTNCTFDGHMYNTLRVMEECLAIKPDLIFLWDEAWFGFARFSPFHRRRTAMGGAAALEARLADPAYRAQCAELRAKLAGTDPRDPRLLDLHLLPDPERARIRVYQTHSTHKSMSALRQGSMILVRDQDFHQVHGAFEEAFFTHTSTSPNQQILASLDVARRQMELEGYELTLNAAELALELRRQINGHPLISKYFRVLPNADMVPAEFRASGVEDYGAPHASWKQVIDAWDSDEFALDPTRLTLVCGTAGFDGTEFKNLLAERYDIQLNKTSRNSILLQTNINNTRSDAAHLMKVLADLSRELDTDLGRGGPARRKAFEERVRSLMDDVPDLPNFSRFHDSFRDDPKSASSEGRMRAAYFAAYRPEVCEFLKVDDPGLDARLRDGPELVAADFVIPYPPGFPIMVPGQVITQSIIDFMRKLDVKEIHGYHAAQGLRLLRPDGIAALRRPGAAD